MFVGHYGVALASKKVSKSISLGTAVMAAQWLDLIWPIFLILKIEHVSVHQGDTKLTPLNFESYPFSHSLLFVIVWSVLFGVFYYFNRRNFKNAIILSILVISHWLLDLIVHKPDLPLYPGGPLEGLGLWNSPLIAISIESLVFIFGIILYLLITTAKDLIGKYAFWGLILFLVLIYVSNLFGPPPPNENTIGFAGLSLWLLVLWAYWIDKHRIVKT